jgi:hypothetical protein
MSVSLSVAMTLMTPRCLRSRRLISRPPDFMFSAPLALKPNATLDANLLRASEQFYKWTTLACK